MSLPRNTPSHSSSPSKSTLQRTGNPAPTTTRNLLPSPQFTEPPSSTASFPQPQDSYEERAIESSTRPPPSIFQPLFTLIEDPITHEHHHPTVHYIFADDEADIITEAACRSLAELGDGETSQSQSRGHFETATTRCLPPAVPGVNEHYIVVDVQPKPASSTHSAAAVANTSYGVSQAYSLSSEWQVLRTNITQAPTIGESDDGEGLMLRIEGRGNTPPDTNAPAGKEKQESLEEMIERFTRRLEDVRLVMDVGGAGKEQQTQGVGEREGD